MVSVEAEDGAEVLSGVDVAFLFCSLGNLFFCRWVFLVRDPFGYFLFRFLSLFFVGVDA